MGPVAIIGLGVVGGGSLVAIGRSIYRRLRNGSGGLALPPAPKKAGHMSAAELARLVAAEPWTQVPPDFGPFLGARPELRGRPTNTILAVPGLAKLGPEFRAALLDVAERVGIPVDSLAAIMSHESKLDPSAQLEMRKGKVVKRGMGDFVAAGLAQFTPGANLPGLQTLDELRALQKVSAVDQLKFVEAMFQRQKGARGASPGALLMWNFLPVAASSPDSTVLGRKGSSELLAGSKLTLGRIYEANPGLDPGQKRGFFTKGDVVASVRRIARASSGQRLTVDGTAFHYAPRSGASSAPGATSKISSPTSSTSSAPAASAPSPAPSSASSLAPTPEPRTALLEELSGMPNAASAGGILLRAARAGALLPTLRWSEVRVGPLTVRVTSDALRALDGVRYPVSMDDAMAIAKMLGAILPTDAVNDAIWKQAKIRIEPRPLPPTREMGSLGWTRKFSRDVDEQIRALGGQEGDLVAPVGKDWILHPRLVEQGAVNYGWQTKAGVPLQSVGGRHNAQHFDYSQVLRLVDPHAKDATSGEPVDLRQALDKETKGAISKWLTALA